MSVDLSIHPGSIHPTETFHSPESKASGASDKPFSPVATSGHDPFSAAVDAGLPSSSTPRKYGMQNITARNESSQSAIKDPDTDAPIPTSKHPFVTPDGKVIWPPPDTQGAKPGASTNDSTPALPPQAAIDPAQR